MKILAIDTSTSLASVALSIDGVTFFEEKPALKEHATCLLPMIESLLTSACCELQDLDGIVFGQGPGSFTGLRIACSVAKGLAYAHDLPLFAVSGLDAIAYQARRELSDEVNLLAMLDARMHQVYWAHYTKACIVSSAYVSDASAVNVSSASRLCIVGVGFEDYLHDLPLTLRDACVESKTVYPHATTMLRFVEEQRPSPINLALAEPLYIRNKVTEGEPRG